MKEVVYKIRNKRTGEWGDGTGGSLAVWSESFLYTTNYTAPGPAKAVIKQRASKAKKEKRNWPMAGYWRSLEAFVADAEVVKVTITATVEPA